MDSVHLRDLDSDCIGADGKESEAALQQWTSTLSMNAEMLQCAS
jgi:hypothetical protein